MFQAYGTYVFPLGHGPARSTSASWRARSASRATTRKDQINYSRSYWFNYLPFYHMGVRTNYRFNDAVADLLADQRHAADRGVQRLQGSACSARSINPATSVTWTINYYIGAGAPGRRADPDARRADAADAAGSVDRADRSRAGRPAAHLRLVCHLAGDAEDASRSRATTSSAARGTSPGPGRSTAPSHVNGGAVYARHR